MEGVYSFWVTLAGFVVAVLAICGVLLKHYKKIAGKYSITWCEFNDWIYAPDGCELPSKYIPYKHVVVENKTDRILRDVTVVTDFSHTSSPKSREEIRWDGSKATISSIDVGKEAVITFYPEGPSGNPVTNVYCEDVSVVRSDESLFSLMLSDRSTRLTVAGGLCVLLLFFSTITPWAIQQNDKNQEMHDKISYAISQYTGYLTTTFVGRELMQDEFERNDLVRYIDENLALDLALKMNNVSTQDELVDLPSVLVLDNGKLDSYINGS